MVASPTESTKTFALSLPCIKLPGAAVFAPTADQRFLLGQATFLSTHSPITMHHYSPNSALQTVTEQNLLDNLLQPSPSLLGNRVFVLYGAAGSGKSELMRWLQLQIAERDENRSDVALRIARTDLDILQIARRFKQRFLDTSFEELTELRWQECRNKPRTLAKVLLLTALERLLDADEVINFLYYQLIDVVQDNFEKWFIQNDTDLSQLAQLDLISQEDFARIKAEMSLKVDIEYETLRYRLMQVFQEQLLESFQFPVVLREISYKVYRERGLRPILLIDDLVQSISLFATDLLDYFMTLEEGNWDVVIGITPNALESSARGKELLRRINYLDTIDDRVKKLWLSDEYGSQSFFLNEENCLDYVRRYLSEYKIRNGQACNRSCPSFRKCHTLEPENQANLLVPFNPEALIRLFRSLPSGKGKARYLNTYLYNVLEQTALSGELLPVAGRYIKSELAVHHPDENVRLVYSLYATFTDTPDTEQQNALNKFFGLEEILADSGEPVVVPLYNPTTGKLKLAESSAAHSETELTAIDPGKETIRDWLNGEPNINKQLLRNLRRGAVKAIKEAFFLDLMTRLNIANPNRILRWTQTRYETVPPVALEGLDDYVGLELNRNIGVLAYFLYDYADAMGKVEANLRRQILEQPAFAELLFEATRYREAIQEQLVSQLEVSVEELAYILYVLAVQIAKAPVALPKDIQLFFGATFSVQRYPTGLEDIRPQLSNSQLTMIRRLFDDCFKLRENVYDGYSLTALAQKLTPGRVDSYLLNLDEIAKKIDPDYRVNDTPLGEFLAEIAVEVNKLVECANSPATYELITKTVQNLPSQSLDESAKKLLQIVGQSGSSDTNIATFLKKCSIFALHNILCLIRQMEETGYQASLQEVRNLLTVYSEEKEYKALEKHFDQDELQILLRFLEPGHRQTCRQLEPKFLTKIARHLPNFYEHLEISLRGSQN
jgi:hypothetical protein